MFVFVLFCFVLFCFVLFCFVLLKQLLKFFLNSLLTSPRNGQSQLTSNTEANSAVVIMKGGHGSLKICNTSGNHKSFIHTPGESLKIYNTFKIYRALSR